MYDKRDGLPKYVGATGTGLKRRFNAHRHSKGKSKREIWIQSIKEFVEIQQIEIVEDSVALEREEYWINFYAESLVNLRIGNKASKELSEIFSKSQKAKGVNWDALKKTHDKVRGTKKPASWGENLKVKLTGKPKPKEAVEKMKKTHTEKYGFPVWVNDIKYDSVNEASRQTGISRSTIKLYMENKVKKLKYKIHN